MRALVALAQVLFTRPGYPLYLCFAKDAASIPARKYIPTKLHTSNPLLKELDSRWYPFLIFAKTT